MYVRGGVGMGGVGLGGAEGRGGEGRGRGEVEKLRKRVIAKRLIYK